MGILNWFVKKTPPTTKSEEEKAEEAELRRIKVESARQKATLEIETARLRAEEENLRTELRIQEIKDKIADLTGDDEDLYDDYDVEEPSEDKIFGKLLTLVTNKVQAPPASTSSPHAAQTSQPTAGSYSDEFIKAELDKLTPFQLATAKKLPDDELKRTLIQIDPNITADGITRTISAIRAKK